MGAQTSFLLPVLPFVPLLAALFVAFAESGEAGRRVAFLTGTLVPLGIAASLTAVLVPDSGAALTLLTAWRGFLYADLLTLLMVCCTFFLVAAVGLYSFAYMRHERESGAVSERGERAYFVLLLLFSAFMTWTLTISHLFFMFLVVEIATICVSLLVAAYKTKYALIASFKYNLLVVMAVLFAVMGAVLIFAKMTATNPHLTRINLLDMGILASLLPAPLALAVVACFTCAFGTKGGMMPFHSWLPDAHSEAPAPISALLSGLVITVGPFCFARTVSLFSPRYPPVVIFSVGVACVSIVLGILMAIAQDDLKRLLAYSSISQIGYVFAGVGLGTYLGIYGGLFHAVTHMLAKALLFFCAGAILYRVGIRKISDLGGLSRKMPLTAVCFFIGALSIGGLPLLAGFMSKYTVVLALARSHLWWAMVLAAVAGLLTLAAMVWAGQRVFWAEESEKVSALPERNAEMPLAMSIPMVVLAIASVVLGLFPQLLYPVLDGAARSVLALGAK
ncbi:MAG: proton-conducting transporter membrane subunit [Acidobacteriota bacterium]